MRLLDFLIFALSGLLGWVAKIAWDEVKQMRRDFVELEKGLPKEYVRKADWDRATDRIALEIRAFRDEMKDQFDSMWRELKSKADKGGD
jgi:hypothetical protein